MFAKCLNGKFRVTGKKAHYILGLLLVVYTTVFGTEALVLHYDRPAIGDSDAETTTQARGRGGGGGYMRNALLLGNGRLGAMFGGGIDQEHLVLNEITAWANASRGRDEVSQSGFRLGSHKYLETGSKFTREYFVSYPNDLMVVRYTSDGEPLTLKRTDP